MVEQIIYTHLTGLIIGAHTAEVLGPHPQEMDARINELAFPVRVPLECVRATWIVDAKSRVSGDDATLPEGYDMSAIADMLSWAAEVRGDDGYGRGWHMTSLSTSYLCDDGRLRTIGEMLEGISVDLMAHDEVDFDFDLLMTCFGCDWTHPLSPTMHPAGFLGDEKQFIQTDLVVTHCPVRSELFL